MVQIIHHEGKKSLEKLAGNHPDQPTSDRVGNNFFHYPVQLAMLCKLLNTVRVKPGALIK